jgi:hypothetical protein
MMSELSAADKPSARRNGSVSSDCVFQIACFDTGDQTNVFQHRKLLLGFGRISKD